MDVSMGIGSSVISFALIEMFGSDSVDGFWMSKPIVVVLNSGRRNAGRPDRACVS